MLKDFVQLYQIGRKLGLTRKEINGSFFFKEETHSFKNRIIFHIVLLFIMISIGFLIVLMGFSGTTSTNSTYPSGTRYSTIRIKDFKKKFRQ